MITVKELTEMLNKLPPDMPVYTAGEEGIFQLEGGNLMPFKVLAGRLYIDDGLGAHGAISNMWTPLDEHVSVCLH